MSIEWMPGAMSTMTPPSTPTPTKSGAPEPFNSPSPTNTTVDAPWTPKSIKELKDFVEDLPDNLGDFLESLGEEGADDTGADDKGADDKGTDDKGTDDKGTDGDGLDDGLDDGMDDGMDDDKFDEACGKLSAVPHPFSPERKRKRDELVVPKLKGGWVPRGGPGAYAAARADLKARLGAPTPRLSSEQSPAQVDDALAKLRDMQARVARIGAEPRKGPKTAKKAKKKIKKAGNRVHAVQRV